MLPILAVFLHGCGGGGVTPCGDTAIAVGGECVRALACGQGTVQRDLECVPTGGACGDNTREVDGSCVPATDVVCSEGTHVVDGVCVADDALACGAGTTEVDGTCLPTTTLICGPGTVLTETDDGDACELQCDPPEIWSVPGQECVSQCGDSTAFNSETGVCEPLCGEAQFWDVDSDSCLGVPECGVGTVMDSDAAECEGWPFQELSLETLCARRAVNVCERLISCCEDTGMLSSYFGNLYYKANRDVVSYDTIDQLVDFPADEETCRTIEFWECETRGTAQIRDAIDNGLATENGAGVIAFDEFYAEAGCNQPLGRMLWDLTLLEDLFTPNIATGGECSGDTFCADDGVCIYSGESRLTTCQPRDALNDQCQMGETELQGSCQEGLICVDSGDAGGTRRCRERYVENDACSGLERYLSSDSGCGEGLICRREEYIEEMQSYCLPPIDNYDNTCPVAEEYGRIDWCGPNLYCRSDAVPGSDGVGKCADTRGRASACELPLERNLWQYDAESGHSICDDTLACTLQPDADSFVGSCDDTESVCNHLLTECGFYEALGYEYCEVAE